MNDPIDIANQIVNTLNNNGYDARTWAKNDHCRVYVKRRLSRRTQDMGYVEVLSNGERNYNGLSRQKGGIRDLVEGSLVAA